MGSLAVLMPVAVGAGVPGPAGLCVLRGQALGFLRVGGGLPPRRCVGTASCGAACARALAVVTAARRIAKDLVVIAQILFLQSGSLSRVPEISDFGRID